MTTATRPPTTRSPATERPVFVPVRHGDRPVGAFVVDAGETTFVPVVDVTLLAVIGLATAAVTAAAVALGASRRRPAIGAVTMGPGGWVSLRNAAAPALRPQAGRPWWARLLRAHRLVVAHR
ncbi:hypothetical protein [Spirilliplanes yamanashiensis]|uniref:Uncharacterized protein n=1 Tax=Spirilliplanes yamanashiensis TaxID=42233 RepID=A0A8J3YC06_9ACTN|nr:hypothetical protein [Spirilliplanes yamanashiensis]MDP9818132.1 hypothetical protein [Spirilliplanes yamanashiensis]GIJ04943.1 hypothetical protein Sya03_42950 [Spirilliplanes yamanashiensis]